MKSIDTSAITATIGFPPKGGTIDHLQAMSKDMFTELCLSFIGSSYNPSSFYILRGCNSSTSIVGGVVYTNVTAGLFFYNGELYQCDAVSFNSSSVGTIPICNIVTTYNTTNADPTLFTDGVTRNVHLIKKIVISGGTTGSGLFDLSTAIRVANFNPTYAQITSWGGGGTTETINFKENKNIKYTNAFISGNQLSFDLTEAVVGAEVRLEINVNTTSTLTINTPSTTRMIYEVAKPATFFTGYMVIYATYRGVGVDGYNIISLQCYNPQ